jgi:hypothetical protein
MLEYQLNRSYKKAIELTQTDLDHLSLAVLDNFASQREEIRLTTQLSIVRLGNLEAKAQALLERHLMETEDNAQNSFSSMPSKIPTHTLLYHFVGKVPEPFREHYNLFSEAKNAFQTVIDALKINKPGLVSCYPDHNLFDGDKFEGFKRFTDPVIISNRQVGTTYQPLHRDVALYTLDDGNEIRFVQEILQTVHERKIAPLKIALTRFARLFGRESIADQILDAAIALEAIYLYKTSSELKYRLGLRLATHLGRDAEQKQQLFNFVDAVYFVRSKIAHGEVYTSAEIKEKLAKERLFKNSGWISGEIILDGLIGVLRKSFQSILLDVGEKTFQSKFHSDLDKATLLSGTFKGYAADQ